MTIGSESKFDTFVENIKTAFIKAGKIPDTEDEFEEMMKPFFPNEEEAKDLVNLIESIGEDKCEERFIELIYPTAEALSKK